MSRSIGPIAALALTSALCGCATITRGTTTPFNIDSTPTAAQVTTSSGFSCAATPCTFRMPRKDGFTVIVSKAGYTPSQTEIRSGVAANGTAGFVGNALVGGVIGAVVDINSGAMNDLTPNPLHVDLQPVAAVPPPESPPTDPTATTGAPTPPPSGPTPVAPATPALTQGAADAPAQTIP